MSGITKKQDIMRASDAWRERNAKSKCATCGDKIVGKAWRIENEKFACTLCNNEAPGV